MAINTDFIKDHMEDQPYSAECSECKNDLKVSIVKMHSDFDIDIEVEPCQNCLDEARNEEK
jgi:hypothetical protein